MSWLTISQTSGEGDAEITLSASSHTELEQRVASLKVYGQKAYAIETVMQKADEGFIVDPTQLTFDYKSGTQEISITANTSWQIYVDEGAYTLSETAHTFGYTAETVTITVTSDYDWTVSSEDDWITVTKGDGSFTVAVAENTGATRNGTVTLYNYLGTASATLSIEQNGEEDLIKVIYTSTNGKVVTPYSSKGIASNTYKDGVGRITFNDASNIGNLSFWGCSTLVTITFPSDVSIVLSNTVFNGCTSLTTVDLGGVTEIRNYAFAECRSLASVASPNLITLGTYAFSGCTSLTTVDLGSATEIGEYAFYECPDLTSVTAPNLVTLGIAAFSGCTSLTSVTAPNLDTLAAATFCKCTSLTTVDLGGVTEIKLNAFKECTRLTSISLPKAVTLGDTTFHYCTSLVSASLPNVTTIGERTFYECTSLKTVDLSSITSMGDGTFLKCGALEEVTLNDALTSIPADTFQYCSALTTINMDMSNILTVGDNAFYNCGRLTSIELPAVTSIGARAFYDSYRLTYMDLGNLASLANYSIYCSSLSTIYVRNSTAPEIEDYFLVVASTGTLYYPKGADYSTWLTKFGSGWTGQEIES